jgi:peptidoglycan/xylan/chitin deacetylase (PgdA/CDA1 family)
MINLCFHGVGKPERELEPSEGQYWIAPEQLDELLEVARRSPAFAITFDDGNASDVAIALPVLRRHGLTATFFVVAGRLGERGSLGPGDLGELRRAGMRIGSHGMRHRPWRGLDRAGLHEELVEARERLAEVCGAPVREAACPFGEYDRSVLAALRRAGLARVYTVDGGAARSGAWLQTRHTVRDVDTSATIEKLARRSAPESTILTLKRTVKRWR